MANSWQGEGDPPSWLPPPAGDWNGMSPLRAASGKLRALQKIDFQRACLPYLQILLSGNVTETPEMRQLDASGIDHIVWSSKDDSHIEAAFQCKGFSVIESDVGPQQAEECLKSIQKFTKSGLVADCYVIIHNRDNRSPNFRDPVLDALAKLRGEGKATWTALWDRRDLLRAACDALVPRIEQAWRLHDDAVGSRMRGLLGVGTVDRVPVRTATFHFASGGSRVNADALEPSLSDPVDALVEDLQDGQGVRLLLGGFGYGKTTTALRLAGRLGRQSVLIPGALLRADRSDGRHAFWQAVDQDALLADIPSANFEALEPLASVVAENLLLRIRDDIVLVVDGVDESPQANRSNGLAQLLNTVTESGVPVILTMRSEFWHARLAEVASGLKSRKGGIANRSTKLEGFVAHELTMWDDEQVLALVALAEEQARSAEDDVSSRRLREFADLLGTDQFRATYGDIPRRPLFLRMLIADVSSDGIRNLSAVDLIDGWIRRKLLRDVENPEALAPGGGHRPDLGTSAETPSAAVDLAYTIMDEAAALTIRPADGSEDDGWSLSPELSWDELAQRIPALAARKDLAATCNRTILTPIGVQLPGRRRRVAFAHRALQEFFVARHARLHPNELPPGKVPLAVEEWITAMESAGYP